MPANSYIYLLTNPGAESGSIAGWTGNSTFSVRSVDPSPLTGSYYFYGGASTALSTARQDITITDIAANNDIDSGLARIGFSWYQASYSAAEGDTGTISLHFLNAAGATISNLVLPAIAASRDWQRREYNGNLIPALTRTIRVQMNAIRTGGTNNDAYFDDLSYLTVYLDSNVATNVTTSYAEVASNVSLESSNVTASYVELSSNLSLDSSNITTSYVELSSNLSLDSSNITISYAELAFNTAIETSNVSSEYIEVGANSTPPEPLITAEYVEVSLNAAITPRITTEYMELSSKAISFANVTTQYAELGLKAVSNSQINLTSQYAEVSTNTGFGAANVQQIYTQIESDLNIKGNADVSILTTEVLSGPVYSSGANVSYLSAEIINGIGANNSANISQMYMEFIVGIVYPQVLVAGI